MNEIESIGDAIDRLITVDITHRGTVRMLYEAARAKINRPLSLVAAERLLQRLEPERHVVILTGFPERVDIKPTQETDGPTGAATLARGLYVGFRIWPVIVCDKYFASTMEATCTGAGLMPMTLEQIRKTKGAKSTAAVTVEGLPLNIPDDKAERDAKDQLSELDPVAVISVERPGRNDRGFCHNAIGENISAATANTDCYFEAAKDAGIMTVGVGDGGNELGLGLIEEEIKNGIPFGRKCGCSCGGGIAPHAVADSLVIATVSNGGTWGIEACLSALAKNRAVLHSAEVELRTLRECVDNGGIDGSSYFVDPAVDGIPAHICVNILEILRTIVDTRS